MRKQNYQEVKFLEKYWNNEKNNIDLINAKLENKFMYWWFCQDFDHSFEKTIRSMEKNQSCMVCIGKQLLSGFNDFETAGVEYMHEWDYEKTVVQPNEILKSSKTLIWWKCKLNHSWQANTQDKIRNRGGCPYCANQRLLKGFNDLESQYPELTEEWDFNKNSLKPSEVRYSSTKNISWICKNNHQWDTAPFNRTNKKRCWSCPYCTNRKVLKGYNDLATTHPHMIEQWDYAKNKINPTELTSGSNKKVWWLCRKFNHSWIVSINEKTRYDCPYCGKQKALKGFNDLITTHPEIIQYWDYEKNILNPDEISAGSDKIVWWNCDCGNNFSQSIYNRTKKQYSCNRCSYQGSSQGEKDLFNFIESLLNDDEIILSNVRSVITPYELDIYVPHLNIALEYNGTYWHSDEVIQNNHGMSSDEYHLMKTELCNDLGIKLLHIAEEDWTNNNSELKNLVESFVNSSKIV